MRSKYISQFTGGIEHELFVWPQGGQLTVLATSICGNSEVVVTLASKFLDARLDKIFGSLARNEKV